ncbi:hypothetical protein L249_5409 [Ophiocordyceps polyrhachis-furcata BCC 54312]|uniref:SUN domain-containing protein n=1 Tax=Ophiocordyceps polyrhachis-furcata BCC 54312 TaxID=1330021 RepID=A0A367L8Y5_9HYPO|nr:hypothetical protein L249_5409 [Ophiocordyceps polyrhachis-furcata BCC 54312]
MSLTTVVPDYSRIKKYRADRALMMHIFILRLSPALPILSASLYPWVLAYGDDLGNPASREGVANPSTPSIALTTPSSISSPSLCEARTVNYITHMLPQLCLTNSWDGSGFTTYHSFRSGSTYQSTLAAESFRTSLLSDSSMSSLDGQPAEPTSFSFVSFEDWKEMMLRQVGQDPQTWRSRKVNQQVDYRFAPDDAHGAGLGEEGEISLDFVDYRNIDGKETKTESLHDEREGEAIEEAILPYGETVTHRSKDAGKTCKERFSYASFDAGATVLKSATGAKNARAILVENKDTYMLLECAVRSKYVIVELSDDILVDTVVIANFEFFSSMIRHFRVSVSDRYPVNVNKWRELGVFEARNSRDIQPFLVENPQIWAKYIRLEFLSHYGNEYYCPVSLLRVHGSRMLDSWKDSETGRDEDLQVHGQESVKKMTNVDNTPPTSKPVNFAGKIPTPSITTPWTGPWGAGLFHVLASATCPASSGQTSRNSSDHRASIDRDNAVESRRSEASAPEQPPEVSSPTLLARTSLHEASTALPTITPTDLSIASHSDDDEAAASSLTESANASATAAKDTATEGSDVTVSSATKSPAPGVTNGKPRTSGASGANGATTTVQEGFFNAIAKRLQQVESNLTLSLKYVEEQSRHVQEALQRGEQKQRSKVTLFLNDLNQTVLSELRNIREQYDQIWQSTVLALDSQADRSERDIMALSTRLNLLAEEVVFQKRMAILQAVILLSCLFLVIFSRGVPVPPLVSLPVTTDPPIPSHLFMYLHCITKISTIIPGPPLTHLLVVTLAVSTILNHYYLQGAPHKLSILANRFLLSPSTLDCVTTHEPDPGGTFPSDTR